jgi:rhomboid family protein
VIPLRDNIPTRRFPIVTIALIVANAAMYFLFQRASTANVFEYGAIPYELTHLGEQCTHAAVSSCGPADGSQPGALTTVLTSMFMHGGLLHLAGNMLFLWIFGSSVEDSMGRIRFLLFYLLGGGVAFAVQALAAPDAVVPTVGASGAVAAVLGGYALLYPRARVVTLVIIILFITLVELPAVLVLGLWFLLQVLNGSVEQVGQGGVAYFAHIGGFVFGLVLIKLFANRFNPDYDEPGRLPVY